MSYTEGGPIVFGADPLVRNSGVCVSETFSWIQDILWAICNHLCMGITLEHDEGLIRVL